jgi:hypothetical protein
MNNEHTVVSELADVLLASQDRKPEDYRLPQNIFEVTVEVPFTSEPTKLYSYKHLSKRLLKGKHYTGE